MKRFSKELQKSYKILVLIFSFSFIGLLSAFGNYIIDSAKAGVITVNTFINYELTEMEEELEEHGTMEKVFLEALEEGPKIENVYLIFRHQDKVYYCDEKYPKDVELKIMGEEIQNIGFYDYIGIYRVVEINGFDPIEVIIINDLKKDKILFFRTAIIAFFWLLLTIGIGAIISKKFYQKFNSSINNICEITSNVNLASIDEDIAYKEEFVEFDNVIHVYKKMLTRLKEQSDAQIDFVNSASHELKTPIFIISGYIDLIKRWGLKEESILEESIESISEESKNMASLVNKFLFLAKNNQDILELSIINVTDIINECINDLKLIYSNQEISFDCLSIEIKSDLFLMRQLVLNLLENAIKYGNGKPVEIKMEKNQYLLISIRDKGDGISKEDLEHIYEKFYRVDKSRSRASGSHGLGLSIVKKIIELLKGDIKITSKEGSGTTVVVTFPYFIE